MTAKRAPNWVLVPGTLCTPQVFDPVLRHLGVSAERQRVLLADAPFAGDYAHRLKETVRPGDIVCGFSLGALVLAHNLDSIGGAGAVVFLSLNPLADAPGNAEARRQTRDRIMAGGARGWVAENWSRMSVQNNLGLMAMVADMAEETSALIQPQTELALSRPDASESLRNATLPLVFVTGSKDEMTPARNVVDIGVDAQNAYVEVLDGLGHFALLESPDRVGDAVAKGLSFVMKDYAYAGR